MPQRYAGKVSQFPKYTGNTDKGSNDNAKRHKPSQPELTNCYAIPTRVTHRNRAPSKKLTWRRNKHGARINQNWGGFSQGQMESQYEVFPVLLLEQYFSSSINPPPFRKHNPSNCIPITTVGTPIKCSIPSILLTNICHVSNKVDELSAVVELNNPSLVMVTESWLNEDIPTLLSGLVANSMYIVATDKHLEAES